MARLWKRVDGEPYMINPRLGVLALQALNPKGRKMAKHWGKSHMAWVRSFAKKNRPHRRRHHKMNYRRRHKRNPYPLAGPAMALGNPRRRRHYKRNPFSLSGHAAGLGLPSIEQMAYGGIGFIGTAAVQGFADTLMPTTMNAASSNVVKYIEIAASIVLVSWGMKAAFGNDAGNLGGVGGGIFLVSQAAHDFLPGVIPGMHAYTPLKAYTPLRPSSTMGRSVASAGGGMPQLAARGGGMRAPAFGPENTVDSAADGGMNVIANRFRRFQ